MRSKDYEERSVGAYRHGPPDAQTPPTHLNPFVTHPLSSDPPKGSDNTEEARDVASQIETEWP